MIEELLDDPISSMEEWTGTGGGLVWVARTASTGAGVVVVAIDGVGCTLGGGGKVCPYPKCVSFNISRYYGDTVWIRYLIQCVSSFLQTVPAAVPLVTAAQLEM